MPVLLFIHGRLSPSPCSSLYYTVFVADDVSVALSSSSSVSAAAAARSLFRRYADRRLSSVSSGYVSNTTVDVCAVTCVSETEFQCRSFAYDNKHKSCLLYTVNTAERDVRLIAAVDVDVYDCESPLPLCSPCYSHSGMFGLGLVCVTLVLASCGKVKDMTVLNS